MGSQFSILAMIQQGYYATYPLLFISVVCLAIIFERVWVLATSGASAPFIGLFGTVVGILVAFQSMAIMGTGGFSVVAAGISEALISTALGLAVAIVAVIFFNYFSVKIQNINALLQINGDRLIDAALQGRQAGGR